MLFCVYTKGEISKTSCHLIYTTFFLDSRSLRAHCLVDWIVCPIVLMHSVLTCAKMLNVYPICTIAHPSRTSLWRCSSISWCYSDSYEIHHTTFWSRSEILSIQNVCSKVQFSFNYLLTDVSCGLHISSLYLWGCNLLLLSDAKSSFSSTGCGSRGIFTFLI